MRAVRGREEREGEEGREEKSRVRQARSEALMCDASTAQLHKTVAEKDKYISRLSEQAKAQVSYSLSHLSHSPVSLLPLQLGSRGTGLKLRL